MKSITSFFAVLVGLFLLAEGIWGLNSDVVFGSLTTNTLHAIIHIALGVFGLYVGIKNKAKGFCIFLGLLLIAVGGLWYLNATHDFVADLFNMNMAVARLNLIVGAVSLAIGASNK